MALATLLALGTRGVQAGVDKDPVHSQTNNTQLSRTSEAPFIQAPWSRVSQTACPLVLRGAQALQCPRPQTPHAPQPNLLQGHTRMLA